MSPNLPVELWRVIFRQATSIPRKLEVICEVNLLDGDYSQAGIRSLHVASLSTKVALSTVCKSWYYLAVELLYEEIHPYSTQRVHALEQMLTRRGNSQRGTERGYGWYTEVLEIPLLRTYSSADVLPLLLNLLPFFPNLNALIIQGSFGADNDGSIDTYDQLAQALNRWTPKLRYLSCYQWDMTRTRAGFIFLQHVPSLQILRTSWSDPVDLSQQPCLHTGNITSLSFSSDLGFDLPIANFIFPSLTSLILVGTSIYRTGVTHFVDVHGSQLRVLAIPEDYALQLFKNEGVTLLERLLRVTPNLHELLVGWPVRRRAVVSALDRSHADVVQISSLTVLGVWAIGRSIGMPDLERLFHIRRFPNLKRIRLLNILAGAVRAGVDLRDLRDICDIPGIVIEDALGNLIE